MNAPIEEEKRFVDPLSFVSCFLTTYFQGTRLASGTCFFVQSEAGLILITNRHNFTGRNNFTGKVLHSKGGIPDSAVVHIQTHKGEIHYHIDLLDHNIEGKFAWTEHPTLGASADVVAIPIKELENAIGGNRSIQIPDPWHSLSVTNEVHVIGYAFGRVSDIFPVWSRGYIATEPAYEVAQLPVFLIDCKSRAGQSGSPVFSRFKKGDVVESNGNEYQAKKEMHHFLGVYSGRIRADSDLGIVWKQQCLRELVAHASKQGTQHIMAKRRQIFDVPLDKPFSFLGMINDIEAF